MRCLDTLVAVRAVALLPFLLLFLAVHVPRPASAQIEFDAARAFPTNDRAFTFALGDFDEDALVDAAVLSWEKVDIHLGFSTGTSPTIVTLPVAGRTHLVFVADFDADGHQDVAVTPHGRGPIDIHFGDGRGGFSDPVPVEPNPNDYGRKRVVSADFDGDGDSDLAVTDDDLLGTHVLLARAGRGFDAAPFIAGEFAPVSLATGDIDGDTIPDLVAVDWVQPPQVAALLGDGLGTFRRTGSFTLASPFPIVETGDLDRDGRDEVILASTVDDAFGIPVHSLSILAGDADGSLSLSSRLLTTRQVFDLAPVDIDDDGNLDVVVNHGVGLVNWLVGDGTERPASIRALCETTLFTTIGFGDVNGDGALDIVSNPGPFLAVTLAAAKGRFEGPAPIVSGGIPRRPILTDIHGDGTLDLLTTNSALGPGVVIQSGLGGGEFTAGGQLRTPYFPDAVAVSDFDRDGIPDLAIGGATAAVARISLWLGTGSWFESSTEISLNASYGLMVSGILAADVNGDGRSDAIIETPTRYGIEVALGDGQGGFASTRRLPDSGWPSGIAANDVNEDGFDDVIHVAGPRLEIHAGSPAGDFVQLTPVPTGLQARIVLAADVNGDGHLDLVVMGYGSDESTAFLGDGAGAFAPARACALGSHIDSASLEDVDGDGLLDLAAVHYPGILSVASGDGLGGFGSCVRFAAGARRSIASGDIDQDGFVDVVGEGDSGGKLLWLRNLAFQLPRFACWRGTVNAGAGEITDVLFVNDGTGGLLRTVPLVTYQPVSVFVQAPPSATGSSPFALFGWRGRPPSSGASDAPFGIGTTCMPTPLSGGSPDVIWNNTGKRALGAPTRPSTAAPSFVLQRSQGLGRSATFLLQGIIADPGSAGTRPASVTNAILVEVR